MSGTTINHVGNLIGHTITAVTGMVAGSEEVIIETTGGLLRMFHDQDCCEVVQVEDVTGDPADLIGCVVVTAEERVSECADDKYESATWTFYEIRTTLGDVTIRCPGEGNGYYSEGVDCLWLDAGGDGVGDE